MLLSAHQIPWVKPSVTQTLLRVWLELILRIELLELLSAKTCQIFCVKCPRSVLCIIRVFIHPVSELYMYYSYLKKSTKRRERLAQCSNFMGKTSLATLLRLSGFPYKSHFVNCEIFRMLQSLCPQALRGLKFSRAITSCSKPLSQGTAKCIVSDMKMIFILMQTKLIFTRNALELGNSP